MKITGWAAQTAKAPLAPWQTDVPVGPVDCVVKVISCGLCHSDIHMVDNDWQISRYPLIPGHEVVGEVVEVGSQVTHLKVGDRVGIGWQLSSCLNCPQCLKGNENLCPERRSLIGDGYGGFADYCVVDSHFAFKLPDGIDSYDAGPLMCGGITVYSALKEAGMGSGLHIGVIGVGGLGHMAVQFASKLGNTVTALTTSADKAELAAQLGASDAILLKEGSPTGKPHRPFDILLNTAPAVMNWSELLGLMAPDGVFSFVASPSVPLEIPAFSLIVGRLKVMGSPIGGRARIVEMLEIADGFGVKPIIEKYKMSQINEAFDRVKANQVRYRAVLIPDN